MSTAEFAWLAVAIFCGGIVRGFTGFGFAIVATPLLSLVLPPAEAVGTVLILQTAIGLADIRHAWPIAHLALLRPVVLAMAAGTPVGLLALETMSETTARLVLAAVLALGSGLVLSGVRLKRHGRLAGLGVGFLSGLFNGLAAMPGPPVVAYTLALPFEPAVMRATLIVYFLITALVALAVGTWSGLVGTTQAIGAALALPLLLLGSVAGSRLFRGAPARLYRRASIAILVGLTVVFALRALLDAASGS